MFKWNILHRRPGFSANGNLQVKEMNNDSVQQVYDETILELFISSNQNKTKK